MIPIPRRLKPTLVLALLALSAAVPVARAQFDAGPLANWADLATWARYDEASKRTEMGLGLIPTGPFGSMRLSFEARLDGRRPSQPATGVALRLAPTPLLNPNTLRSAVLRFEIDERKKERVVFDLSSRLVSLDATPGSHISSASALMTIEELERLAVAETIKADIMGIAVEFGAVQIRAIKDYTDRVMLRTRAR